MTLSRRDVLARAGLGAAAGLLAVAGKASAFGSDPIDDSAHLGPLPPVPQANGKTMLTPDEALARLKEGNGRFAINEPVPMDLSSRRRMALAQGQAPFAAIVACADSRAGPEQLFGAGLGELFVVRTAGNYVDTAGMGSLEFGVGTLGARLIVVLGHERCGAVKAAASVVKANARLPGSLGPMVEPIIPAVLQAKSEHHEGGDLIEDAGRANVKRVVETLRTTTSPVLKDLIASGRIKVVGAYYDLDTGIVDFFDTGGR